METIIEKFEKTVKVVNKQLENDKGYIDLKNFYEEMKKNGYVKEPKFDLSPIDTIGRVMFLRLE